MWFSYPFHRLCLSILTKERSKMCRRNYVRVWVCVSLFTCLHKHSHLFAYFAKRKENEGEAKNFLKLWNFTRERNVSDVSVWENCTKRNQQNCSSVRFCYSCQCKFACERTFSSFSRSFVVRLGVFFYGLDFFHCSNVELDFYSFHFIAFYLSMSRFVCVFLCFDLNIPLTLQGSSVDSRRQSETNKLLKFYEFEMLKWCTCFDLT